MKVSTRSDGSPWLGLGEASRLLGITPATLRRWADHGEVAAFVTPGGHRRFPRSVIESLLPPLKRGRPVLGLRSSLDRMARAYRRARPVAASPVRPWLAGLSDTERAELRSRGHLLLETMLAHLDAPPGDAASQLASAQSLAAAYGIRAAELGATLGETVEAFLRFRSSFVGELAGVARRRRLNTPEATALLVRAESGLDRLLIALMKGHEERS